MRAFAAALALLPAALAYRGYEIIDERTYLEGNSFGIPGNATYDYVIVGGGTAGLAIAARLAEEASLSIAVIEAGLFYEQANSNLSQVPAYCVRYSNADPEQVQPAVDWGIVTVPQPQLGGRKIHYTQGKCFGGGSCRNYMLYQRGTVGTHQRWADLVDDDTYTWGEVAPYYQKSVNFTPPNYAKRGSDVHAHYDPSAFSKSGGPLLVSYFNYYMHLSPYLAKAFRALGMKEIPGSNSGSLIGYTEITTSIDPVAQVRSSSETSFMQQAMHTTSMQIYENTLARRVLFDGEVATGVEVTTAGKTYVLSARKEVILSAGVFRSPQLLMLSGIGPAETLNQFNITVIKDLPGVGQNILDHPFYDIVYRSRIQTQSRLTSNASFLAEAKDQYLNEQKGPLTAPAANYMGWEKLPREYRAHLSDSTRKALAEFPDDWPELQYVPVPAAVVPTNDTDDYFSSSVTLVATTSRGNMTLISADASDNPAVNIAWLSSKSDQELAVAGFKRARQLADATGIVVGEEVFPGESVHTDKQILEFLQSEVRPIHHAVASCSMGKANDPQAVVDSQTRVFGVKGLRIVDSSVFPVLPPGQIQSTVYMLAEKIADLILKGLK